MRLIETKNATITRTILGFENHGIFSFMLQLDYGGAGQGFGGYALDNFSKEHDRRLGTAAGMDLISRILTLLDVKKWEDLPGTSIRVRAEHNKIHAIGHYLRDDWLDIEKHFESWEENHDQVAT